MAISKFRIGQKVEKARGYNFQGKILSAFMRPDKPHFFYVVMNEHPAAYGLMFIFAEDNLVPEGKRND
jgi:heat shock protein HspQ